MNETNTTTVESATNATELNNQHVVVKIDELITPFGVTLKGLTFDAGAGYTDEVNRDLCQLVKAIVTDYVAPLVNRAIDKLEKDSERSNKRRDEERAEEHAEHLARLAKIEAETEAIRNGKGNDED